MAFVAKGRRPQRTTRPHASAPTAATATAAGTTSHHSQASHLPAAVSALERRAGNTRGRTGVAGSPRVVVTSHGKRQAILWVLMVFCCLDSTNAAGGYAWKWASQGQTCTAGCGGLTCVDKFDKVNSGSAFQAAKGSKSCGNGYRSSTDNSISDGSNAPFKHDSWRFCYYQSGGGGSCASSKSGWTRLCPCTCAAGTYSDSDLKPYPCTRYDHFQHRVVLLQGHLVWRLCCCYCHRCRRCCCCRRCSCRRRLKSYREDVIV
jgi:hypothetical protein